MSGRLRLVYYTLSGIGATYGTMAILRHYNSGEAYIGEEKLYGKTVVVTGANTGIGKEVSRNLAKRGARVIMACRNMDKCQKAKKEIVDETFNRNVECMQCDLASLESIKSFTDQLRLKEKSINLLVNNAGIMWIPKSYTKEGFEMHLGVNHLGHFYLTNQLLDKLKASLGSRIINVSCKSYKNGRINFDDLNSSKMYDDRAAYDQSKLANLLFTLELNDRLQNTDVKVYSVDPGVVYTELLKHTSFEKSTTAKYLVGPFFKTFMKTPAMGAQTIIKCCVDDSISDQNGKYFRNNKVVELNENALNKENAKRLWAISERWTKLK